MNFVPIETLKDSKNSIAAQVDAGLIDGKKFIRKHFPRARFPLKWCLVFLLRHELNVMRTLEHLSFVCKSSFMRGDSLYQPHVDGVPLKRCGERIDEKIVQKIACAIREMHRRKVVHLDLRQRKNILVTDSGEIAIIDFSSAIDFSKFPPGLIFFDILRIADESAVVKIKRKYLPESVTEADRRIDFLRRLLAFFLFR